MGTTSRTNDVTDDTNYAGTANERDINLDYSRGFYNYLTGGGQDQIGQSLAANARSQAQEAFSPYGIAMQDYARQQSEDMRRQTEQRLAGSGVLGTGSGAANRAIAQAIASPYAQANVNLAQQYGQMYQGAYGNLQGNLAGMSQQQLVAPQFQDRRTPWGTALDIGTQLGGAALGAWNPLRR